jgi:two-component system phosphate regulon sensor histidine kinase PhoR
VPVAWGEGIFGAVLFLRDVTELDQAVQLKTDFVANASHELRTPVSAIRAAAETLVEGALDDRMMGKRLSSMILTHATRLEEMLRDLLDLSRLETPDAPVVVQRVVLHDVETSLRQMFEPMLATRSLTLDFAISPDVAAIRTDPKLLLLILRNLVENAAKFAYEGTAISVAASLVSRDLASSTGLPRGVVRFEVTDRGIGIPLQHQERVFERYFQVDQARTGPASTRGTGLGLSIVKHAARILRGRVGLSSVYKEGTTAWAEVPCDLEREQQTGAGRQSRAG